MKKRITYALAIAAALAVMFLVLESVSRSADEHKGKTPIRVQLQWSPQAQFIGFYVAKLKGFYEAQKLDVTLLPGGFNTPPINSVISGNADIGSATGDQVLLSRYNKLPIKAVGVVFPRSIAGFMSRTNLNIRAPADFRGKKIGYYAGFDTENLIHGLLRKYGLDAQSDVSLTAVASLQAFISATVDLFPVYEINEPLMMHRQGIGVNVLMPDNFGVEYYSDTLFTTEQFLGRNRAAVQRFLDATAQGWDYARSNPDEALAIFVAAEPGIGASDEGKAHQRAMLGKTLEIIRKGTRRDVFRMDLDRWENMCQSLSDIGKLNNAPGDLVKSLCDPKVISDE
jgi:ABC-type nitrate/sulfonate/bicarbonate transport system substrate-binding protein